MLFAFRFAAAGEPGYDDVGLVAAAVILSIPRFYLGPRWSRDWRALDVAPRRDRGRTEQALACPVRLGRGCVAFPISRDLLDTPRQCASRRMPVMLGDVIGERLGHPPRTLIDVVRELFRMRLGEAQPSLDLVAQALDIRPRSLQRRLSKEGLPSGNPRQWRR